MKWVRVRKNGWLCGDGRYIAKFNWSCCYVYLLYVSMQEYEKQGADYQTFYSLKNAKQPPSRGLTEQQGVNKMNSHFKKFCDKTQKTRDGYVPELIDMSEHDKDAAVVATMKDMGMIERAIAHQSLSNDDKNECYSSLEVVIQDAIDSYNEGIDVLRELELLIPLSEDEELFLDEPYTAEDYCCPPKDFC